MCLEAGKREEPIPGVVRNDWGRTKWNSQETSLGTAKEVVYGTDSVYTLTLTVLPSCISLGSHVGEMETEGRE